MPVGITIERETESQYPKERLAHFINALHYFSSMACRGKSPESWLDYTCCKSPLLPSLPLFYINFPLGPTRFGACINYRSGIFLSHGRCDVDFLHIDFLQTCNKWLALQTWPHSFCFCHPKPTSNYRRTILSSYTMLPICHLWYCLWSSAIECLPLIHLPQLSQLHSALHTIEFPIPNPSCHMYSRINLLYFGKFPQKCLSREVAIGPLPWMVPISNLKDFFSSCQLTSTKSLTMQFIHSSVSPRSYIWGI